MEVLKSLGEYEDGPAIETVGGITADQRTAKSGNGERTSQRSVGDLERELQELDREAEYARRGLDGERERDKERQRLLREKAGRERAEHSQRDPRDNAGGTGVQSGSQPNDKKRDNSFSK